MRFCVESGVGLISPNLLIANGVLVVILGFSIYPMVKSSHSAYCIIFTHFLLAVLHIRDH